MWALKLDSETALFTAKSLASNTVNISGRTKEQKKGENGGAIPCKFLIIIISISDVLRPLNLYVGREKDESAVEG